MLAPMSGVSGWSSGDGQARHRRASLACVSSARCFSCRKRHFARLGHDRTVVLALAGTGAAVIAVIILPLLIAYITIARLVVCGMRRRIREFAHAGIGVLIAAFTTNIALLRKRGGLTGCLIRLCQVGARCGYGRRSYGLA